jgi:hypothetical protein
MKLVFVLVRLYCLMKFTYYRKHLTTMHQLKLVAVMILASVAIIEAADHPSYIDCADTKDCAADQCCVVGVYRRND